MFASSVAWWSAVWWHQLLCFELSNGNAMSLYFLRQGGEGLFGAPQPLSHILDSIPPGGPFPWFLLGSTGTRILLS